MPNKKGEILSNFISRNLVYILLIACLCITLCIYNLRWIIPSIIIFILAVAYSIWVSSKKENELQTHIQNLTSYVDTASKGNLVNTPIPLVLVETNGNIIWRSKKFVEEFGEDS